MTSQAGSADGFLDEMLFDFLDESAQIFERLNENLLILDGWVRAETAGEFDRELLNEMFRAAHSLKGLSAMLGLGEINRLTHRIENVFDAARNKELPLTPEVVEHLFLGYDGLLELVGDLRDSSRSAADVSNVLDGIQSLLNSAGAAKTVASQADAEAALAALMAPAVPVPAGPVPVAPVPAVPIPAPRADQFADIADETEIPAKYLAIFLDETDASLDQLAEDLLKEEAVGSVAPLKNLMVVAHRIKGGAASIGLQRAAKLAHGMEDALQQRIDAGRPLTPPVVDALLRCTDGLRQYLVGLRDGNPRTDRFNELSHQLWASHAAVPTEAAPKLPAEEVGAADVSPEAADLLRELRDKFSATAGYAGAALFEPQFPLSALKAQLVVEKLHRLGQVAHCAPTIDELDVLDSVACLSFVVATTLAPEEVRRELRVVGVAEIRLESLGASPPRAAVPPREPVSPAKMPAAALAPARSSGAPITAAPALTPVPAAPQAKTTPPPSKATPPAKAESDAPAKAAGDSGKPNETLRVDIERLDQLMNLAGELVISKARFARIGDQLKPLTASRQATQLVADCGRIVAQMAQLGDPAQRAPGAAQRDLESCLSQVVRLQAQLEALSRETQQWQQSRAAVNDLLDAVHQLDRVSDGIQKSVMDTRMVPIGPLFGRFRRVVRDITRASGKDIQLVIRGEKTELDKRMIDELGDPLIHMVRNSADHGVEPPDVREAAGKPRQGTVTLDAFHRGNTIVIQVADDGKGLDPERIRKKAIERGLLSQEDAEKYSPHQLYQLIWEPGFSTAEKVTEISGRGMGMDIVRSKIEDLNGSIELSSEPGRGATFTIKLPLTLAILPSLMVEVAGDVFTVPIETVVEIVRVGPRDLKQVHGKLTARVRSRVVSVTSLEELFTWSVAQRSEAAAGDDRTLVILHDGEREIGLVVDDLLGEEDIVIKSLAENYQNVAGVAGASILGDGRVALILDVAALVAMAAESAERPPARLASPAVSEMSSATVTR